MSNTLKINNPYTFKETKESNDYVIFVDGSGGGDWVDVVQELETDDFNILNFQFTKNQNLLNDVIELGNVISAIVDINPIAEITIIPTSQGAVSATWVAAASKYAKKIKKIIYVDPADYYLEDHVDLDPKTWSGFDSYSPAEPTLLDMIESINLDIAVNVINFTLNNCIAGQYASEIFSERGQNIRNGHSRINSRMVEYFYNMAKYQGVYIEDSSLPHAFNRDGNPSLNRQRIIGYLCLILKRRF